MKQLLLIRHAKSDWNDFNLTDFDRPLNERGQRDAPRMGARLKKTGIKPDIFLSSPALRARSTAEFIAMSLTFPTAQIEWVNELYLASATGMMAIIRHTPDTFNTLALVAHNPGISDLAASLANINIGNIPTCGTVHLRCDSDNWSMAGNFTLVDFDYPKRNQTSD
ncbi:MAG: histidine phosphatase family protein [Mariprofundaceae bacterium]